MKTEERLGIALKELMTKESLETITVKRLADICRINRQTFYYHFRDIYDLLTWIYLNEPIRGLEKVTTWKEAFSLLFKYIDGNRSFIKSTLDSAGREMFIEYLFDACQAMHMRALTKFDEKKILSVEDKKFIARFYTPSFIYVILHWVDTGFADDANSILENLDTICDNYLIEAIEKFVRLRKKSK